MFHKVRVLNKKGQLLKVITSEVLSNRHWTIFEEKLKPRPGKKNKFNDFNKDGSRRGTYSLGLDTFGLEGWSISLPI